MRNREDRKPVLTVIKSGDLDNQRVVEITYEGDVKVIKVIKEGNGIPTEGELNA